MDEDFVLLLAATPWVLRSVRVSTSRDAIFWNALLVMACRTTSISVSSHPTVSSLYTRLCSYTPDAAVLYSFRISVCAGVVSCMLADAGRRWLYAALLRCLILPVRCLTLLVRCLIFGYRTLIWLKNRGCVVQVLC